jgi:hypothetical protein
VRGAAASVNLTIAAAMATLVAVGGILAGPAILDCSKTPGGFGACLRDRLDRSPPVPLGPPIEDGWLDANANEYEPPSSPPVDLEASPAALSASELPSASAVPAEVAIAPPSDLAVASPVLDMPTATVALLGPEGTLAVAAVPGPSADPSVARQPLVPTPDLAIPVEPPSSEPAPVVLSAESSSEPPSPEPTPVEPEPSLEPPTLIVEFNPAYPNVIVLPTPLTGEDSSFRSLEFN